jgi:hypothetical protein
MKKYIGLGVVALLLNGCAMSSTYNRHQTLKPRAAQAKALQMNALQIKASGQGQEVFMGAGVDWTKMQGEVSILDTISEDPKGMSKAIAWDALKAAAVAWGVKYINDEYLQDKSNDNDDPNRQTISAKDGAAININNAPNTNFGNSDIKASGSNSRIDVNYVEPEEEENDNAPFNLDGTPNLDGNI